MKKRSGLVQYCFNDDSILNDNELQHNNKKTDERERKPNRSQTDAIKKAVRKCEIPHCSKGKSADIVHHINGDRTDPSYGNLIVLCTQHHAEAEGKTGPCKIPQKGRPADLSKARLRKIVRDRDSEDLKRKIRNILAKKGING